MCGERAGPCLVKVSAREIPPRVKYDACRFCAWWMFVTGLSAELCVYFRSPKTVSSHISDCTIC